jgi:hypothetical protein
VMVWYASRLAFNARRGAVFECYSTAWHGLSKVGLGNH